MSTLAERWPTGTIVEVRNGGRWEAATVVSAGYQPPVVVRIPGGGDRIEVEIMLTGQRALISESYNGIPNIRAWPAVGTDRNPCNDPDCPWCND